MNKLKTYIAVHDYNNDPIFDDEGAVLAFQAYNVSDAQRCWNKLAISNDIVDCNLVEINVYRALPPISLLISLTAVDPLLLWSMFDMKECDDEEIGGYEGWLTVDEIAYHASSTYDDKYGINITVIS